MTNFLAQGPNQSLSNCITFNAPATEEVIRLDSEGFHYHGQFIADAGEAHRLMLGFFKQNARPTIEPVPVTEWLPGPEDCDAEGCCWFYSGRYDRWERLLYKLRHGYTHWLPHHALPVPQQEKTHG